MFHPTWPRDSAGLYTTAGLYQAKKLMSKANERAYELIRDEILTGRFASGDHLPEQKIAEVTGVSRTPVREALRRLESEHMVTFLPNRGAYVANWSADAVDDIFNLRVLLEGYAAERAAVRIDEEQIACLEQCVSDIDRSLQAPMDYDAVLEANNRFHRTLLDAAQSERLLILVPALLYTPIMVQTLKHYDDEDLKRSNRHHEELVAACRARDPEWARNVMASHLRAAHRICRERF